MQAAFIPASSAPATTAYVMPNRMPVGLPRWKETTSSVMNGTRRTFAADEGIFAEGDRTEFFYKVVSGTVRTYKLLSDGRRQIDAFHLAGDIFGLECGAAHRYSAETIREAVVVVYKRSALKSLPETDTAFADQMLAAMSRQLESAQNHMLVLGCKNAQEKLATFLLGMASRLPNEGSVELPMMRSDIADHLGLTIETVSRTMSELARDGVIALPRDRRTIELRDLATLRRLSA
jgi:CRP/FNR family transcriptional regulator, nitrogen fixation regulation protein